jgi:hypothetical protein
MNVTLADVFRDGMLALFPLLLPHLLLVLFLAHCYEILINTVSEV